MKIFAADQRDKLEEPNIIELREEFQHGTRTNYEKRKIGQLFEQTKNFIEKTKTILESYIKKNRFTE